jgi:hypothetical protein
MFAVPMLRFRRVANMKRRKREAVAKESSGWVEAMADGGWTLTDI